MLNVSKLMLAGGESSKNELYHGLLEEARDYNSISLGNKEQRIKQLMRLFQVAGWYVTSKPPQNAKFKNRRRWVSVNELLTEAYQEAAGLDVKMLNGPADFKTISGAHKDQSYWLEFLDPQHRPGFQLSGPFKNWLNDSVAIASKQSFWAYIGTNFNPAAYQVLVQYYPESAVYDDAAHLLHFEGGRLKDNLDDNYDTRTMETHFSGNGWAIFVVSPEGKFFSGSHQVGKHHHSSFLGGGAVIAAGEIVIDDGVVKIITAKSGHYKPSAHNMRNLVNRFGEIPGNAIIQADLVGPVVKFHTVAAFRALGNAAPVLRRGELLGNLPLWAASRSNPGGQRGFYDAWLNAPA